MNPPRKKTALWVILYIVTGCVDIFQFFVSLTWIGVPISETMEPFVGVALLGALQFSGVSVITHPKRLASLLAAFGLDALTLGVAPLWILDVFYIHYDYRHQQSQARPETPRVDTPLYGNGIRQPNSSQPSSATRNSNTQPLVTDGVRTPQK